MIICRAKQRSAESSEIEKFNKSSPSCDRQWRKPTFSRHYAWLHHRHCKQKAPISSGKDAMMTSTTSTTTSIIHRSAKEEFLIQFVKRKDGRRRQAELCVRQWKHKDD